MDIHGISIPKLTGPFASGPNQLDFSGLWPCNHLFMVYFSISACHSGTRNMRSSEFYLHVSKFIGEFPKGDPQKSATQVKNQGSQQYRDRPLVWIRAKTRIWAWHSLTEMPETVSIALYLMAINWMQILPCGQSHIFHSHKGPIRAWSAPSHVSQPPRGRPSPSSEARFVLQNTAFRASAFSQKRISCETSLKNWKLWDHFAHISTHSSLNSLWNHLNLISTHSEIIATPSHLNPRPSHSHINSLWDHFTLISAHSQIHSHWDHSTRISTHSEINSLSSSLNLKYLTLISTRTSMPVTRKYPSKRPLITHDNIHPLLNINATNSPPSAPECPALLALLALLPGFPK